MREHIYLNCAMDVLKKLRNDPNFEAAFEYEPYEARPRLMQHEYGRIKSAYNYYHILSGSIPQEGCPWCNSPAEVLKLWSPDLNNNSVYCIQCMKCGARGPSLNVSKEIESKSEFFHECMGLLWQRWKTRRAWHCGFVNPYEVVDDTVEKA